MKKLITYKMALIIATILLGGMAACEEPSSPQEPIPEITPPIDDSVIGEDNSGEPIFATGTNIVTIDSTAQKISVKFIKQVDFAEIYYITNYVNKVMIDRVFLEKPLPTTYKGEWYTFRTYNKYVEFEAEPNTSKDRRGVVIDLLLPIPFLDYFSVTQAPATE